MRCGEVIQESCWRSQGSRGRVYHKNAMSSDQSTIQKPPTSPPPPPVPRRPSFKVLNKLKHALSVDGAETEQSTNTTTFDTKSETPIPTDKDNENIFNSVAKASREIYYGNHTLLFASTEIGGFFLSSDDDGYATLKDTPSPVCFTNARNPFLRYGDVVRVMAHNCNLIGHTSNSWMSWSKDVASSAGLFRIHPRWR